MPPPDRTRRPHAARTSGARSPRPAREDDGRLARPPGYAARHAAVEAIFLTMQRGRFLDDALTEAFAAPLCRDLEPRDRAFARLIVTTALRRHGELGAVINAFVERPLPAKRGKLWQILLSAAAQLLLLDTPPHAAIGLAVDQCKADFEARRFDKLANAVLRKVASEGRDKLAALDGPALNIPPWMQERWETHYGAQTARAIALSCIEEPALDLTFKAGDAAAWAERLGGVVLPIGTLRVPGAGRIEDLAGYDDGAWWVQDAAAVLPAMMLKAVSGQRVADLCAAPGGKTAQLAAAGADVTAVDISVARLARVEANLQRLGLKAELVQADAAQWSPAEPFDAILLDAPCSATGTIRRHPDILHIKQPRVLQQLIETQARMLDHAADQIKSGGVIVYCTCSLEPEEGASQVARFLASHPGFSRLPLLPGELPGIAAAITADGDLRTLPSHRFEGFEAAGGLDGFFAARLQRL
jgi:16S rRNA (cytosine967-C5)-methyltransferase